MKLNPKDRRRLYLSAGFALVLAAIGGGLTWWSSIDTRDARNALKSAEQQANDIRNRLRQVNIEEQEIQAKSSFFRQLEQRKIVGPEQRLDWVELIENIRQQDRLFEIDYEISMKKEEGPAMGDFNLYASELSFHLPLLHEGDLIGFIGQLQQRAPALVQVKRCEITRAGSRADRQAGDPNLNAHCRLQWSTIGQSAKSGGQS